MLKNKLIVLLLLTSAMTGCASTQKAKVYFDRNDEITTSHYKTFSWLQKSDSATESMNINPVMKARVARAIETAFIAKGYQLINDAEHADFVISYIMSDSDKVKIESFPTTYRTGFFWGNRYYSAIDITNETHAKNYTEDKLAINVYDVKSEQPVWSGWAIQRVKPAKKDEPNKNITTVVEQIVTKF